MIFIYITIVLLIIAEILDYKGFGYQQWTTPMRIIYRCIMMLPMLLSVITNIHWYYSIVLLILYILILAGDCLIDYFYQVSAVIFYIVQIVLITVFTVICGNFNPIPLMFILLASLLYYNYLSSYLKWPETLIAGVYILLISIDLWRGLTIDSLILTIGMILWYLCDIQVLYQIYVERLKITKWGQIINNFLWYGALISLAIFNYWS